MSYYNSLLWENPQVIYPLNALKESFGHYISACQHIIRTSRLDLNQQANLIVEANSPFELKSSLPHKTGALLIHGLLDSPFSMRDIGHSLYEQGLSVRSILLPGHGTVPGNLLNITFQEWAQACHYAMTAFTEEVEKVFLVGFSTGATLALYHALQHAKDPRIAGLVLVCPAIKINTPIDFLLQLSPYFHWLGKRGEWIRKTAEIDYTRYQSIAFNAAYQVYQLANVVKKLSQTTRLDLPIFTILSQDDETISCKAALDYLQAYTQSQVLLYGNTAIRANPRIMLRPSIYPDLGIQHFSHIALPIAPTNLHYGEHGDYADTRNSFNPDFDFMAQAINAFIATVD